MSDDNPLLTEARPLVARAAEVMPPCEEEVSLLVVVERPPAPEVPAPKRLGLHAAAIELDRHAGVFPPALRQRSSGTARAFVRLAVGPIEDDVGVDTCPAPSTESRRAGRCWRGWRTGAGDETEHQRDWDAAAARCARPLATPLARRRRRPELLLLSPQEHAAAEDEAEPGEDDHDVHGLHVVHGAFGAPRSWRIEHHHVVEVAPLRHGGVEDDATAKSSALPLISMSFACGTRARSAGTRLVPRPSPRCWSSKTTS